MQPGTRRDVFERLGFKTGDVITAIDGEPVTQDRQWNPLPAALDSGAVVNVTVLRAGSLTYLTLDGRAIEPER